MALDDLTGQNIQDTYKRVVQTDGTELRDGSGSLLPISIDGNNVTISGSLTANEYIVSSSVTNITVATLSGSTEFGDDVEDTHKFTGSLFVSGNLTFGSTANNRKGIYFQDTGTKIIGDGNYITIDGDNQIDLIADNNIYITSPNTTTNGNLNADGNISASGGAVYSTNFYADNTYRINDSGGTSRHFITRYNNTISLGNTNFDGINLTGSLSTNGHITASGNISASSAQSTFTAATGSYHVLKGDTTKATGLSIEGTITASGNISSSGTGSFGDIQSAGGISLTTQTVGYQFDNVSVFYHDGNDIQIGDATNHVNFPGKGLIVSQITASGNISSSGVIKGSDYEIGNRKFASTSTTDSAGILLGNVGEGNLLLTNLTASGNISSSKEIIAGSANITNITGSNISASGTITAANIELEPGGAIRPTTNNNTISFRAVDHGSGEWMEIGDDLFKVYQQGVSTFNITRTDSHEGTITLNDSNKNYDIIIKSDASNDLFTADASADLIKTRGRLNIGNLTVASAAGGLNQTTHELYVTGSTFLSGSLEMTDRFVGNNITLGDTAITTPSYDIHVRNSLSATLALESWGNNNAIINFLSNQNNATGEPDFSIGQYHTNGGLQIRSDNKTFITVGATGSLSGDPAADTIEISGSVDISSNITASGDISASGDVHCDNLVMGTRINANQIGANGNVGNTEYGYLNNLGDNIQTQFNNISSATGSYAVTGSNVLFNDISASGAITASGNLKANYIETAKIPMIQYISTDVTSVNQGRVLAASAHDNATDSFALEWDTSLFEDTDFFETGNPTAKTGSNATTFAVKQTGRYEISCGVAFRTLSGARPGLNLGIFTSSVVSSVGALRAPGVGSHGYSRFAGSQMGTSANIANFVIQLTSGSAISMKVDYKDDWGGISNTVWSGSLSYFNMKKIG